jgi:divalent metal cation (Fe/Co/Zn/Cd) transporter
MNRIGLYAVVHWTVGLIILIMGFYGLYPGQNPLGYEPVWHAWLKIVLALVIISVGIKFTWDYLTNRSG